MNAGERIEFIYVGDPMCSWCWGFAPTLERLQRDFSIPIRTIVGGLRPGPDARPLDDEMRAYLAHHWQQVADRSGQPFDRTFLERDIDWVYDTELPAIAVATMRSLHSDRTLEFFTRLQRAFYADGLDITHQSAYPPLLSELGVPVDPFMAALESSEMQQAAWADFAEARSMGIGGFPALLLDTGTRMVLVCRGWAPPDAVTAGVKTYLERELPSLAPAMLRSGSES